MKSLAIFLATCESLTNRDLVDGLDHTRVLNRSSVVELLE